MFKLAFVDPQYQTNLANQKNNPPNLPTFLQGGPLQGEKTPVTRLYWL